MTKKDYELVARAMVQARQDVWNSHSYEQWKSCCECLAQRFLIMNTKFNRQKFIDACNEDF